MVNTVGRGLRFSRNDRTVGVIKLFIIWLTVWNKEKSKIIRAEVVNLYPAMRAFTDSFIVSDPGQNHTVLGIPSKTHFFTGENVTASKLKVF